MTPCTMRRCTNGAAAGMQGRCYLHLPPIAAVEAVSDGLLAVTWEQPAPDPTEGTNE